MDVGVHAAPSSDLPSSPEEDSTELVGDLDEAEARIAKPESVGTVTGRRHEESLHEIKKCHAEEIGVWKGTYAENADSLVNDVKIAKADSVMMSVKAEFDFGSLRGVRSCSAGLG